MGLTAFQITVAELFFSLPESDGFLLAGGAALAAQCLTTRPIQDLDLFTRAGRGTVPAARDAFENVARERGWSVQRIRDADTFCRLLVSGDDDLLVDLALDSPPSLSVAVMPRNTTSPSCKTVKVTSSPSLTFGASRTSAGNVTWFFLRTCARPTAISSPYACIAPIAQSSKATQR
jgi:hypothetical protein